VTTGTVPLVLPMSGREFRSFQQTRPDQERWELVRGVPVMMVPPTIAHNRIAGNLMRLLNEALARQGSIRRAIQRSGVELGDTALAAVVDGDYRPEPDVMVIDGAFEPGQRFVNRAYVLAEVVSDTDNQPVPGTNEPWIAVKRRLYLAHLPCEAVILIEPDRIEVRLDLRSEWGWEPCQLTRPQDRLVVPSCGLDCRIADIYEGTPLLRYAREP
jgi:Uma2 family endonuclease